MKLHHFGQIIFLSLLACILSSCAHRPIAMQPVDHDHPYYDSFDQSRYPGRLPKNIPYTEKLILIDPNLYAWGAYQDGQLVRGGIATAGGEYCIDEEGSCRTIPGSFRIFSMKGEDCYSRTYPRPTGGWKMPYCMFFNGGQSIHGAPDNMLVESHTSHGCVRIRIPDAEWLQKHFAYIGTKVVIVPY